MNLGSFYILVIYNLLDNNMAFFWWALKTNFLGFYMNYNKEAKSVTCWRVQKSAKIMS